MNDKYKESFLKIGDTLIYPEKFLFNPIGVCSYQAYYEIEKLQAENAKLKECAEFYSVNGLSNATVGTKIDTKLMHQFYISGEYARQVLKEVEEK